MNVRLETKILAENTGRLPDRLGRNPGVDPGNTHITESRNVQMESHQSASDKGWQEGDVMVCRADSACTLHLPPGVAWQEVKTQLKNGQRTMQPFFKNGKQPGSV